MRNEDLDLIPKECCDFGEFKCQVPIPINGHVEYIDLCIAKYVAALNAANITTIASCCGHGKISANIIIENGNDICIRKFTLKNYIKKGI